MFRTSLKTRLFEDGRMEIVDPDMESLPFLKSIDPGFRIKMGRLSNFSQPRVMASIMRRLPYKKGDLGEISTTDLWMIHDKTLHFDGGLPSEGEVNLLDLKIELAKRELKECRLCGRGCGVDRWLGERGFCALGADGKVGECFIHIAEEAPINPSQNIGVMGCGLQCRFCQKYDLIDPKGQGRPLEPSLWEELDSRTARSLSFVGGNPDESVYGILGFLAHVPSSFKLPVVWNSNGYASRTVYRLLRGIVDAYVPDMKFFRSACSRDLAGCDNYFEMFRNGIEEMLEQRVPILVRMLILPGHLECCHIPLIDFLSRYSNELKLNLLSQYYPDYKVSSKDAPLNRRPSSLETEDLRFYAELKGGKSWLVVND